MPYVKNSILRGNTINLLDCKSTEFILLRNKTLLCSITKEEFVWDFKKHKSLEKFYTHLLKVSMRRIFGKQYDKGEDISILIDNAVKNEMDRIFKGAEIKSKKLVDLV